MENQSDPFTPERFIRTLSIIHLGLIAGPLVFGLIVYFNSQSTHINFSNTDDMFLIVIPIFALSSIFLGNFIFGQSIKNIARTSSLRQKLVRFQTASIIRYALVEAAAFFGIIAYYMTGNLVFMLISAILILYFFMLRPTREKIIRTLNLTGSDKAAFNKGNQPLN
ncbi:hypothetical protein [Flagellimonas sp.]|uniref:hypothetical protein n=1 Tax=Flagellimonas sp. TaxID=2058762 RepID=UPI003B5AB271